MKMLFQISVNHTINEELDFFEGGKGEGQGDPHLYIQISIIIGKHENNFI